MSGTNQKNALLFATARSSYFCEISGIALSNESQNLLVTVPEIIKVSICYCVNEDNG
jgi:hypothetical protein